MSFQVALFGEHYPLYKLGFAFLIGLVSAFYGSITGGAGMITIPGMIALGLPPEIALGTNKLGDIARFSTSSIPFIRSKNVEWKIAKKIIPIAIIGGIIGPFLLTYFAKEDLSLIIGIIILAMAPVAFIGKRFGIEEHAPKKIREIVGYLVYFLVTIYGASIQVASGVMLIYVLVWFFGRTMIQANATNVIIWWFITIAALASFVYYDMINYAIGIFLMSGSALGGYLGAHTAIRKGNKWVKNLFIVLVIVMAIKVLIFG